jgi:hypothetical protein
MISSVTITMSSPEGACGWGSPQVGFRAILRASIPGDRRSSPSRAQRAWPGTCGQAIFTSPAAIGPEAKNDQNVWNRGEEWLISVEQWVNPPLRYPLLLNHNLHHESIHRNPPVLEHSYESSSPAVTSTSSALLLRVRERKRMALLRFSWQRWRPGRPWQGLLVMVREWEYHISLIFTYIYYSYTNMYF